MKIAVLSGKGGTGKTFVSVNLSAVIENSIYCDCDVEEPNGELFLKPCYSDKTDVFVKAPLINKDKCVGCRKCVDFCRFNALVFIREKPMVFSDICHFCGGCKLVCEHDAISETNKQVGIIKKGKSGAIRLLTGVLNIGEPSAVPIISKVLSMVKDEKNVVIDCPPGSSCSVMESIKDADFAIIVTEPTSFAFENFKMVYKLCTLMNKKCGVVINKSECDYQPLENFLSENKIPLLKKIPFKREIAKCLSEGNIVALKDENYYKMFQDILIKGGLL